jgi:hypothetical protein
MPASKSSRAKRAVNPTPTDIAEKVLAFSECGLAVQSRGDIGAVAIKAQDRQGGIEILLAPVQARAVALLLLACAETVASAEGDRP